MCSGREGGGETYTIRMGAVFACCRGRPQLSALLCSLPPLAAPAAYALFALLAALRYYIASPYIKTDKYYSFFNLLL